ncbi:low affinity immunoglobulin gamma Fc region receptor II-like [Archocentrus centrarchus]|uniref:low affinity immunoglobulin gamma Fc region receptor II-like n=1 Tax=Archocentrus centrarchus TaxID=63155 RepID=UPI0011E9B93D|nr:low affinity immunoglobulin gamma Fc region receptor II-like [Archocentrus centrarchus]
MAVRALCIRLLVTLIILLSAHDPKVDAVSLHIVPNRLQFFEYESVIFYCEGAVYWEVVHNINGKINLCSHTNKKTPAGSFCTIKNVYTDDSGEYWCETEGGKRSNSINIAVTAGSVILEVPAVPVMEGEAVTLRCRNKTTSSNFTANFYKVGRHVHRSSTGEMTIRKVSNVREGLYKCNISGAGESPESWLNVTRKWNHDTQTDPSSDPCCHVYLVFRTVFTIMMVALLLLLVVLLHSGKIRAARTNSWLPSCYGDKRENDSASDDN